MSSLKIESHQKNHLFDLTESQNNQFVQEFLVSFQSQNVIFLNKVLQPAQQLVKLSFLH